MSGRGSVPASGLTHTEQNEAGLGITAHRDPMWGMGQDIWGKTTFPETSAMRKDALLDVMAQMEAVREGKKNLQQLLAAALGS